MSLYIQYKGTDGLFLENFNKGNEKKMKKLNLMTLVLASMITTKNVNASGEYLDLPTGNVAPGDREGIVDLIAAMKIQVARDAEYLEEISRGVKIPEFKIRQDCKNRKILSAKLCEKNAEFANAAAYGQEETVQKLLDVVSQETINNAFVDSILPGKKAIVRMLLPKAEQKAKDEGLMSAILYNKKEIFLMLLPEASQEGKDEARKRAGKLFNSKWAIKML
jgi:hypothetical protein